MNNAELDALVLATDAREGEAAATDDGDVGDDEIVRLAKLPPMQYEKERKAAAERMGVRASVLDKLVAAKRPDDEKKDLQGRALVLPEPEAWADAVDGAALLSDISAAIAAHVILPATGADVVALWVLHSHAVEAFPITPRLAIMSPVKGCGKTTLMDSVACLVWRPLSTANATTAGIFRAVEMARPTLLLDEAERFVTNQNDELVGILNSGHRLGGSVLRTVGDDNEPRMFGTFAPCAFALIGRLPDTLEDRSVAIDLRRRTASEPVQPFRLDQTGHLHTLARKAVRWAADHLVALRAADPDVGELFNRAADNWRPLLAIADVAGGAWPGRARAAAEAASKRVADDSVAVELLTDIRTIFAEKQTDRIASADLATALAQIEGHPWAEWGRTRDKPITQNALARQLKKFQTPKDIPIAPENIRIGDHVPKGYLLEQFTDAFSRYLAGTPASEPLHRYNPTATGTSATFQTATRASGVAVVKCEKPPPNGRCSGVAVEKGYISENGRGGPVCDACGTPAGEGAPLLDVGYGDAIGKVHRACLPAWQATQDLDTIPAFLDRRGRA